MAARKKSAARRPTPRKCTPRKRWSQEVTGHSNALDLEQSVCTLKDPHRIALSLKRSAEASKRRKSELRKVFGRA